MEWISRLRDLAITTVVGLAYSITESQRWKRWKARAKARRTTRRIWDRCPDSRPRDKP